MRDQRVVARHGDMDVARWWNTKRMLGHTGAVVLKRGLPSPQLFARARIVFAVARKRCEDLFNPPGCMTPWNMPAGIEDRFEDRWHEWLDHFDDWKPTFDALERHNSGDLTDLLKELGLVTEAHLAEVKKHAPNDEVVPMLAVAFSRGEPGSPAIPYARLDC